MKSLNTKPVKGYRLAEGDIIRLGRLKFRVKEINCGNQENQEAFSLVDMLSQPDEEEEEDGKAYALPCRVCLSEVHNDENPLIAPCNCDGTMKYIHVKCLQSALRCKLKTTSTDSALSFYWKNLSCELCSKQYPYKLYVKGQVVELLEIPKPPCQYIVLESLCSTNSISKGLHLISFCSKKELKVGRSQDCDLRFPDISISRSHAFLVNVGNKVYLEDLCSKFGTIVRTKRPIPLNEYPKIQIQCGKTLLKFQVRKSWSLVPSCFRPEMRTTMGFFQTSGQMPMFPINTGIPLSVEDLNHLLSKANIAFSRRTESKTLELEHDKLGWNSSYEEEERILEIEEVNVAEWEPVQTGDPTQANDTSFDDEQTGVPV